MGHQRPEGVDLAGPRQPLVLRRRPHRARLAAPPAACPSSSCRWTSPGSRCARSSRSPAAGSSTRRSSPTPAPPADLIVGAPGDGWKVAMGLLGFERGISTLAQQVGFERELRHVVDLAGEHGRLDDPVMRQRLAAAYTGLQLMRWNAQRSMGSGVPGPEASISKLFWGTWHRDLGELADGRPRRRGRWSWTAPPTSSRSSRSCSCSPGPTRSTAASNEIQRNVLGERVLGLPR